MAFPRFFQKLFIQGIAEGNARIVGAKPRGNELRQGCRIGKHIVKGQLLALSSVKIPPEDAEPPAMATLISGMRLQDAGHGPVHALYEFAPVNRHAFS